ncbi:MAG: GDP-mannose 4,6-dehydratase [Candidatus Omnitrophica bacterium]|nr:GDP-mannose 4,6-dehydratase [Candidatus Omnitrophota bacterium]
MTQKVLVTGGAGLVGSHVAEYYAKKGCRVTVLDNLMRSKLFGYNRKSVEYNWNYLKKYRNIIRVKGDVRDPRDVNRSLGSGVDIVIHAAGQPGVPSSLKNMKEDLSINAWGTLNVLECVQKRSSHAVFIYCSTNKVYGQNVDRFAVRELKTRYVWTRAKGVSETMALDECGHTPYGVSKCTGDFYTQEFADLYRMRTAVFRMSCIYGPRQFGFEDQGWVAWFMIAALKRRTITVYGDGKQVRDLLFVEDLITAYDRFVKSKKAHAVYNIGGGPHNTLSLQEFLGLLEKEFQYKIKVRFKSWRPSDQKVYISDITRIKKDLNWHPDTSVPEGLKRLLEWVKQERQLFQ